MAPQDRQSQIVSELLHFEDPQERLAYLLDRTRRVPPIPPAERLPECLVQGCLTRVWLRPHFANGRCSYEVDSESAMVRALALLLAQVYSDSTPLEIVSFHSNLLSEARLTHSITPTRLHGLAQLQKNIRSFARSLLPEAAPPASHGPL